MVQIRRYEARDRSAVRQLACDTAARGEPVEQFFRDRDVFADVLLRYYMEWESSSLWVAEAGSDVVGYLTGCLDTRRYECVMRRSILPAAGLRALGRGVLCHRETWRLAWAGLRTLHLAGRRRERWGTAYPAHFHVNLHREARGQGIGERLVAQFLHHAQTTRCLGVHVGVRSDNPSACRFFERLEFVILKRRPTVFPDGSVLSRRETIVYGRTL